MYDTNIIHKIFKSQILYENVIDKNGVRTISSRNGSSRERIFFPLRMIFP